MSALSDQPIRLTWEEYVTFEEVYEGRRHELVRGSVRWMAGASERHDLTVQAVYDQLRAALRGGPCRVFVQNRKVRTGEATGYYPDLVVRCGDAAHRLYEDDARVVVEVLSPSNDPADVTERLFAYRALASIELLLFVDHRRRVVTVHERSGDDWLERRATDGLLDVAGVPADWSRVWVDVDADATTA